MKQPRAQKLNHSTSTTIIIDCNMFDLPAELALSILAYLPLGSIAILPQVCHTWNSFVQSNREQIYHSAAVCHRFIPSTSTSHNELRQWYSTRSLKGVNGWHDFCKSDACAAAAIGVTRHHLGRRRYDIDKAWSGKALSTLTQYSSTGTFVHRIKVDELAGYILTTKLNGGLVVTDLEDDAILWSLPEVRHSCLLLLLYLIVKVRLMFAATHIANMVKDTSFLTAGTGVKKSGVVPPTTT